MCGSVCQVGRPFLVAGAERLAPLAARGDWCITPEFGGSPLSSHPSAKVLAEEWTRVALMEHASIAAFARFALQLLGLGAPPELLESATAAIADETRHAKLCFAIAASFASAALGPGALQIVGSLAECSLVEVVLNTIREGCVGETLAALEAREAAEHAEHPAVRAALLQISADETRHAELAWGFVRWALAEGDAALRSAVAAEFAELARSPATLCAVELTPMDLDLLRGGILPDTLRRVIRKQAIDSVVLPCAQALLERVESGSARRRRLETSAVPSHVYGRLPEAARRSQCPTALPENLRARHEKAVVPRSRSARAQTR
jgi:hypothetical protein